MNIDEIKVYVCIEYWGFCVYIYMYDFNLCMYKGDVCGFRDGLRWFVF